MVELPSGTVTFLFSDVEGSTRLLKQLRERYGQVLAEQRGILRAAFAEYGGREMDTQGDAFFVVFARARDAVAAAVAAQRALVAHIWPEDAVCRVRMGLHTGEPAVGEEGYHGMGVHRGARICAAAHGGQILLSNTTRELAEDELPAGVALRDLGEQWLKDIDRPERVYQLLVDGLRSEFPPLRTAPPPASAGTAARRRPRAILVVGALAALAAVAATIVLVTGGGSKSAAGEVSADSVGVIRSDNGRRVGEVSVGASPRGVAAGFDSVWVSNVDAHSVSRIDPVKRVTIQTIQVGSGPTGIAVGGGFVWVANGQDGTVSQIDPQTDTVVNPIPVGNGPSSVAADAYGVWVANADDGTVTLIDPRTGKVLRRSIQVGESADGVALGFRSVWVTSESAQRVTRIDAQSRRIVATIPTGSSANAVAVGRQAVWVANDLDGTVTRIDPASNTVRATIPVGDGPNGIAVTPGGVWVSNELAGTLSRIDATRNVVVHTVRTGNRPQGLALAADTLYVAVRSSGIGHRGGTLKVRTQVGQADSIDPAIAYFPVTQRTLILTNDGLTAFRRVGGRDGARLVPDLATSLPTASEGGRSYTFQLRPGIRYSTGAVVRAQDIRRAVERALLNTRGPGSLYFSDIVGARACLKKPRRCDLSHGIVTRPGSSAITFRLTAPDPDLLYELALPSAFAVPSTTPAKVRHALPATGPYMIMSYDAKKGIRLARNPHFREWSPAAQPSGYPDEILWSFDRSPEAEVRAVEQGNADLATDAGLTSPATLSALRTQYASRLQLNPQPQTHYIFLNTRLKPFDDVRVRRAVNFAVDRNRMVALFGGTTLAQLTCQVLPPDFGGYRPYCPYTLDPSRTTGAWTAPDLGEARRLVAASGTKGQLVTVWGNRAFKTRGGDYFLSVLKSLGYEARFKLVRDVRTAEERLGIQAQAGGDGWGADYASPSGFFTGALTCRSYTPPTGNSNIAAFCDRGIDAEIEHARSLQTSDPQAASQLWSKIDRDVTHEAPWVAYLNPRALDFVSKRVGDYQFNPQWGALIDQLWVH